MATSFIQRLIPGELVVDGASLDEYSFTTIKKDTDVVRPNQPWSHAKSSVLAGSPFAPYTAPNPRNAHRAVCRFGHLLSLS